MWNFSQIMWSYGKIIAYCSTEIKKRFSNRSDAKKQGEAHCCASPQNFI